MKRRTLGQLLGDKINAEYGEQCAYILSLLNEGKIKPVRTAGKNGKKPALYFEYWLLEEAKDYLE